MHAGCVVARAISRASIPRRAATARSRAARRRAPVGRDEHQPAAIKAAVGVLVLEVAGEIGEDVGPAFASATFSGTE